MAHASGDGAVNRVAENAVLKLVARASMALLPIALAFFGNELWSMAKKSSEATIRFEEKITTLIDGQRNTTALVEGQRINLHELDSRSSAHVHRLDTIDRRLEGVDKRFEGLDKKNDDQDREMREIQRRMWGAPQHLTPPATPSGPSIKPYPR